VIQVEERPVVAAFEVSVEESVAECRPVYSF
jgi:hypothetical protein